MGDNYLTSIGTYVDNVKTGTSGTTKGTNMQGWYNDATNRNVRGTEVFLRTCITILTKQNRPTDMLKKLLITDVAAPQW